MDSCFVTVKVAHVLARKGQFSARLHQFLRPMRRIALKNWLVWH
jgi:hypothetical protein